MITYYEMLAGIVVLMFFGRVKQLHKLRNFNCFLIGTILICVSGFRYQVGSDYITYMYNYEFYKSFDILTKSEPASYLIAHFSAFIYDDYATWFFLFALLTIGLIVYTIYKKSICFEYSILLFIMMGMWHGSMNAVRQYAAIAIIFFAHQFIEKHNVKAWVFFCIVAAFFHVSALLVIPIYFATQSKVNTKKVFIYIIVGVGIFISYSYLFDIATFLKDDTSITTIDSDIGARSVNILRVIINCTPAIFYFCLRMGKKFKENCHNLVYTNVAIINGVLAVASMNSVYLARFNLYTDIFSVLLYPWLLQCFKLRTRIIIGTVILIFYFIFWNVDLLKIDNTANFQWVFDR